jgi:hypothetical protein
MIQVQPSAMWLANPVALLEVDQYLKTFFGVNNAQSPNPKTFVVERRDVEKEDLETLVAKSKDKLTQLSFHGYV